MSDSNGPTRRRRIAGEAGPAAPVKKAAPKRGSAKKAATPRKAAAKEVAPPRKAAAKKVAAARTATAKVAPVVKAPAVKKSTAAQPTTGQVSSKQARTVPVTKPVVPVVPTRKPASTSTPKPAKGERPAGSRPARRDLLWLVPSTLVAVAALVLGAFFVVNPPGSGDSPAAVESSQRQASSAAASAAETIFTFRYDALDEHLTASKALMTPAFAKEFDKIAPALTELAPQREIQVQAQARESAALPCGDECSTTKADVLVFVDQARLVGDSTEPTVFANRIKVSMVKTDDGWLVSDIRAL